MKIIKLHIVAFNVPYPADYGGVIDVFYRVKALSESGVKIHLHCFQYGRKKSEVLEAICEEVTYYSRSRSLIHQFSYKPFIVQTRSNKMLLKNLLDNDWPILFEGLHSCYFLGHPKLKNRIKIVRSHNIEHHYYAGLADKATSIKDRVFFRMEALKLKQFEKVLLHANNIAAISEADQYYLHQKYGKTFLMRPSHPSEEVNIKTGKGNFILYHGDLSTRENTDAVIFIMREIAPRLNVQFVIAGKNPTGILYQEAKICRNVEIRRNPSHEEMQELISNAHINLLPTFQATGFKLKLLNAVFNGRFCMGTPQLVEGTGLQDVCVIVENASDIIDEIERILTIEFSEEMLVKRKALLKSYSNSASISGLLKLI
ncbi:MAG: hypothetical protein ACERKD_14665 [Prolixibacteraceae bacterium]